ISPLLVEDRQIDVDSLALIGSQWPWLHGVLCELFDDEEMEVRQRLQQALGTVAAYLGSLGCPEPLLATAEQIERTCVYLRGVAERGAGGARSPQEEEKGKENEGLEGEMRRSEGAAGERQTATGTVLRIVREEDAPATATATSEEAVVTVEEAAEPEAVVVEV